MTPQLPAGYTLDDQPQLPPGYKLDDPIKINPQSTYAVNGPGVSPAPKRPIGSKVIDYVSDTLSNIPSSAGKLVGNIAHTVAHPIDTGEGLLNTATGVVQKMNPASVPPTPGDADKRAYADAAWSALKDRYGSPHAIAESIKNDPVGVAADIAALAGGVSGAARAGEALAGAASLPRVASTAGKVADTAATVSDVANPLTLPLKGAGAVAKGIAQPLVKKALNLPGRTERYGATPAQAVLDDTRGINPETIAASAQQKIAQYEAELKALPPTRDPDLTAARQVIADAIAKVKGNNGDPAALQPMLDQLSQAKPGFAGRQTVSSVGPGDIVPQQPANLFRGMKQQFGDDYTKFDMANPRSDSTRAVANQAYHELSSEYNSAVPGAAERNQKIQSLIPAKQWASRTSEREGTVERAIDRATRPTGALTAVLFGLHEGGIAGAMKMLGIQEALASPTVKMAGARGAYATGKALSSPITSRTLNTAGVASEAASPDNLPRYAKGGVIKRPTVLVDMASGKPSGIMAEAGPERIVPETAANPTVPEKPDTIGVQLQQLQDGKRRVVMIPQGSFPAPVPHGMQQYADAHGNRYIFNPSSIKQHEIKLAIATNRLPSILGAATGGMGAPDKSRLKGRPVNVVARKKNGTEIQSTVADKKSVSSAVRQSRKLAPRSGSVSVESPSIQIARRVS
jgi:hypothetical protein